MDGFVARLVAWMDVDKAAADNAVVIVSGFLFREHRVSKNHNLVAWRSASRTADRDLSSGCGRCVGSLFGGDGSVRGVGRFI
jgi:hypothetical protein